MKTEIEALTTETVAAVGGLITQNTETSFSYSYPSDATPTLAPHIILLLLVLN